MAEEKDMACETDGVPPDETGAETVAETAEQEEKEQGREQEPDTEPAEDGKLRGSERRRLKRAEAELADTNKKLEALETELAAEKDKYLRMLAEYDNYRRRTAKEKESIYTDASADAVSELLPIIDTLEKAVAGIPEGEEEAPFAKGMRLTLKVAADALRKLDVTEIETITFDPNLHNAVGHIEDESRGEGEIVNVFQKGYRKGDKVIRFAMVQVAN